MIALNAPPSPSDTRERQTAGVDGTYARRSTGASRSSPEAAKRCAEGAGLCAGHARQPGGESPLCNLMEVKHE
jgi:hypothetical protein